MGVPKRILIVDDEEGVLFVLRNTLIKLGSEYEIVTAHDGREGWDMARETPFDLVITDLRMPVMGGLELTEAIKTSRPDTAVIWMTAHSFFGTDDDAARLEVYRCLEKPLAVTEIRQVAREALQGNGDARL
jgi:DNA-binding NtrC family response regulator